MAKKTPQKKFLSQNFKYIAFMCMLKLLSGIFLPFCYQIGFHPKGRLKSNPSAANKDNGEEQFWGEKVNKTECIECKQDLEHQERQRKEAGKREEMNKKRPFKIDYTDVDEAKKKLQRLVM